MSSTTRRSVGGRPKLHPVAGDRYRLQASARTVLVLRVDGDEAHCLYCHRNATPDEVVLAARFLQQHAKLTICNPVHPRARTAELVEA